jgi:hypothetical protein
MQAGQVAYFVIIIIMLLSIAFFIIERMLTSLQHRSSQYLSRKGKRVVAIVTAIRQEMEERGPAQFPRINYCYYIEAEWTDIHTWITYTFRSKRLNSKPREVPGNVLSVLVDPEKPSNYYMELSEDHV